MRLGRFSKKRVEHTVRDAAECMIRDKSTGDALVCLHPHMIGGRTPLLQAFFR